MTDKRIPTWDDIDNLTGSPERESTNAGETGGESWMDLVRSMTEPGQPSRAQRTAAESARVAAARDRLVAARIAATPASAYGGTDTERQRLRRIGAEAFARGAVEAALAAAVRDGGDEQDIVDAIDRTAALQVPAVTA